MYFDEINKLLSEGNFVNKYLMALKKSFASLGIDICEASLCSFP